MTEYNGPQLGHIARAVYCLSKNFPSSTIFIFVISHFKGYDTSKTVEFDVVIGEFGIIIVYLLLYNNSTLKFRNWTVCIN
jgi:hypothetical protein